MLDQVIRAVEFLFGFTLAAGLVVLFAAVTRHARGARARVRGDARDGRRQRACWRQVQRAELLGVGALAGAAGLAGGDGRRLGAGALRLRVRLERRRPGCRWPARAAGALLALAAGWWGLREVLRRPVVETLRRATVQ
ncbi:MAG: hypothetical protein MZW92_22945 [Comamonadaceae bacterium]|nr:hypothetical protein [Comamonadaceae bacterium]